MRRRARIAGWLLTICLMASPLAGQGAQVGGALPLPLPLFPPDNWWNTPVVDAPVDPASAAFIAFIGTDRRLHPDFGGDAESFPEIYGIPYVTVPGSQPLVPVTFEYDDESDHAAPGRPFGYPIPEQAKTQARWIEGGYPATGGSGDRHMLIVDRDNRILYELYALHWNTGLGRWEAGSGAIFPLDSSARRPEGWTSADAAGLAILPGLVRYDEAYGNAPIEHAFRMTVRATNGYVFPASHRAGSTAGALPMGARLRLKASTDLSGYPEPVRRIFQAFKTYGLIVADNGSDMYITGTYDTRWDNSLLNPAFRSLRASDFEVIRLGWTPDQTSCVPPATSVTAQRSRVDRGARGLVLAEISGSPPLELQWYEGARGDRSTPLAGETSASLETPPILGRTSFWLGVRNPCGVAESEAVEIAPWGPRRGVRPPG